MSEMEPAADRAPRHSVEHLIECANRRVHWSSLRSPTLSSLTSDRERLDQCECNRDRQSALAVANL
jgi:hypothetical protein